MLPPASVVSVQRRARPGRQVDVLSGDRRGVADVEDVDVDLGVGDARASVHVGDERDHLRQLLAVARARDRDRDLLVEGGVPVRRRDLVQRAVVPLDLRRDGSDESRGARAEDARDALRQRDDAVGVASRVADLRVRERADVLELRRRGLLRDRLLLERFCAATPETSTLRSAVEMMANSVIASTASISVKPESSRARSRTARRGRAFSRRNMPDRFPSSIPT